MTWDLRNLLRQCRIGATRRHFKIISDLRRQQNLPLVHGNGRASCQCYPHDDQCSPCHADQVI